MRKKKITKIAFITLGIILIGMLLVYISMVSISAYKMKDVVIVGYSSSSGRGIFTEIDFSNKCIREYQYEQGKKYHDNETAISEDKLNKINRALIFCYLPLWKERYDNKNMNDGTYWTSYVIYKDGTKQSINGHEAYPFTFWLLVHEMTSIGIPSIQGHGYI